MELRWVLVLVRVWDKVEWQNSHFTDKLSFRILNESLVGN